MSTGQRENLAAIISQLQQRMQIAKGNTVESSQPSPTPIPEPTHVAEKDDTTDPTDPNNKIAQIKLQLRNWSSKPAEERELKDFLQNEGKSPNSKEASRDLTLVREKQEKAILDIKTKLEKKKAIESVVGRQDSTEQITLRKNIYERFASVPQPTTIQTQAKQTKDGTQMLPSSTGSNGMVTIQTKSEGLPQIRLSSLDEKRDEYLKQFDIQRRPVSESSPIRENLEQIMTQYSNSNIVLKKGESLPKPRDFNSEEKDVVFAKPKELFKENGETGVATGAVVAKEKIVATRTGGAKETGGTLRTGRITEPGKVEKIKVETPADETKGTRTVPPASIKATVEYTDIHKPKNGSGSSLFQIIEWKDSTTQYSELRKVLEES
ncbi:uncharacterized protein LOC111697603 isoform X2 [Eurytemora carolleeae]|uniref:uncharacterized protein LOC111697603 isoform X2 n=1 Tax=Eurytemora carolleeae TaxID=1294199 RepID=UPI000C75B738|nr:uncharacterized protein LOC111697603 isoform X2 [Eurytemora carolleeae]|eukprot:XP_023323431.1 uncharacterized protein LOC111697603 isoform X2 [Eurytemora affinis]